MDKQKPQRDILDEILNRTPDSSPSPTSYPPKFDLPDDIFLPPAKEPEGKEDSDKASRLLPWLCLVLGIALLVMGICVLQVMGMNTRLDELQDMIAEMQGVDSLREENEQLQQKISEMQDTIDKMQQEVSDVQEEAYEDMQRTYARRAEETILRKRSEYLSFLQQFIDRGDFPMAAIIMVQEDETFRDTTLNLFVTEDDSWGLPGMNPIQQAQYDSYRKILVDAGYLYNSGLTQKNGTTPLWVSGYDPTENPDMAALSILWCALDQQYVIRNPYGAAFYVEEASTLGEIELIQSSAGAYALRLYEQMIDELKAEEYLVEEDGRLRPGNSDDIYYSLPFEMPNPGTAE